MKPPGPGKPSFAHTCDWIGGAAFHEAVVAHIDCVPPSSWMLCGYARDFPATLAMLSPDDPEIVELAWLDWAPGETFVAPDAVGLRGEDLGDVDWDHAILRFTPMLDIANLNTNATAIWSALAAGEVPPARNPDQLREIKRCRPVAGARAAIGASRFADVENHNW